MQSNTIYRITKGDEIAFEELMDHYSSRLYHYAYSMIRNKESIEELISDVFMEVWKNRKTLLEIENFSGWLHTITYRKVISFIRHTTSLPQHINLDLIENFTIGEIESADEEMISKEETDQLYEAIQELPPKCKHVFYLAKIDKLPYKDISAMLDISIATINYHIKFAMDALRKKLKRRGP